MKKLHYFYLWLILGYGAVILVVLLLLSGCGMTRPSAVEASNTMGEFSPASSNLTVSPPRNESEAFLHSLDQFDWAAYAGQYGEANAVAKIEMLRGYVAEKVTDKHNSDLTYDEIMLIMSSTQGLDGAKAEAYSELINDLFELDSCKALRCWWLLGSEEQEQIVQMLSLRGRFGQDGEETRKTLKNMYESLSAAWSAAESAMHGLPESALVSNYKFPDIAWAEPESLEDCTQLSEDSTPSGPALYYAVSYSLSDGRTATFYVEQVDAAVLGYRIG